MFYRNAACTVFIHTYKDNATVRVWSEVVEKYIGERVPRSAAAKMLSTMKKKGIIRGS